MAHRPIFIPNSDYPFFSEVLVNFEWHPGLAFSQKQKNVFSLHNAAEDIGYSPILEVSTKSNDGMGIKLSAFNLKLFVPNFGDITIESIFQGSKVFALAGPFKDLYGKRGKEAKSDDRLQNSGQLISFSFLDSSWPLEPKTLFYDWIYLSGLQSIKDIGKKLSRFKGFSDIEFNPKRSFSCQARSCALFASLYQNGKIKDVLADKEYYIQLMTGNQKAAKLYEDPKQLNLFE